MVMIHPLQGGASSLVVGSGPRPFITHIMALNIFLLLLLLFLLFDNPVALRLSPMPMTYCPPLQVDKSTRNKRLLRRDNRELPPNMDPPPPLSTDVVSEVVISIVVLQSLEVPKGEGQTLSHW